MFKKVKKFVCLLILFTFILQIPGYAQVSLDQIKSIAPELVKELGKDGKPETTTQPKAEEITPQKKITIGEEELSQIEKLMTGPEPDDIPLTQFGYSVFAGGSSSFTAPVNQTIGPDYIIGPGDSFSVTLWGISEGTFTATVNKKGEITLPKAGVANVAGVRYGDLKGRLTSALASYYPNINLSVNMEELRSIRIYILGEVKQPGSYLVNSLTGVFNALYACGGPTKKGTLRNIKLIRNGRTVASVDIYDFLLNGNKSGDRYLHDGDTIFVPLIGKVVGIAGNVYRPAIYEINEGASLKDLFYLGGGVMPTSYLNRVQIRRVVANEYKTVLDIDVAKDQMKNQYLTVFNMDTIKVFSIYSGVSQVVFLGGAVKRPGTYQLKEGAKVTDLLPNMDSLLFESYLDRAEIVRTDPVDKTKKVFSVDLKKLFAGDAEQNKELKPLDRLIVYANPQEEIRVIINGEVKVPGTYTVEKGEKLSTVIERAGGFTDKAYVAGAVFTRKSAKADQQAGMNKMIDELERRVITDSSLKINNPEETLIVQERYGRMKELLEKLRANQAKGRVIVKVDTPERLKDTAYDVVLENGDSISVPQIPSVVNVLGEVYDSNSILYEKDKNADYFINKVGGLNKNADGSSLYIVRADGTILSSERYNIWGTRIERGDTIIVPQRVEMSFDWGKWWTITLDNLFKTATIYALVHAATK